MNTSQTRPINVTAAIILRDTPEGTRVLIARRKLDTKLEAGKWEFPGGKLEPFEHPEACLVREIREELDLEIEVGVLFDLASHIYGEGDDRVHILLMCYFCRTDSAEFKKLEVADAKWVSPEELGHYDYAAADVGTVAKLREFLG